MCFVCEIVFEVVEFVVNLSFEISRLELMPWLCPIHNDTNNWNRKSQDHVYGRRAYKCTWQTYGVIYILNVPRPSSQKLYITLYHSIGVTTSVSLFRMG